MGINIDEYQKEARHYIESAEMTEEEWKEVTMAILHASENGGMEVFDTNIYHDEDDKDTADNGEL